tara:strand:- start:2995 stop:3573 length:579 start_codon:yes stop_codon:yes gene_type:complete
MATTIGDLFVRVTAKDQKFNQKMRGVKKTVGGVGSSIGRMAGMFGLALGPAAAIGGTLMLATKYSGQAARSAALLGAEWQKAAIGIGQGFGEIWSMILDDVTELVKWLNDSGVWETIGNAFRDAYKWLKEIVDTLAQFFGGEMAAKQEQMATQGITRGQLDTLQAEAGGGKDAEIVGQLKQLNRTMANGVPQ